MVFPTIVGLCFCQKAVSEKDVSINRSLVFWLTQGVYAAIAFFLRSVLSKAGHFVGFSHLGLGLGVKSCGRRVVKFHGLGFRALVKAGACASTKQSYPNPKGPSTQSYSSSKPITTTTNTKKSQIHDYWTNG